MGEGNDFRSKEGFHDFYIIGKKPVKPVKEMFVELDISIEGHFEMCNCYCKQSSRLVEKKSASDYSVSTA